MSSLASKLAKQSINRALGAQLVKMSSGDIVRKLYPFYLSKIFHGLEDFYAEYLHEFKISDEELEQQGMPLRWTSIHKQYEALLESYLQEFVDLEGITSNELYAALSRATVTDKRSEVLIKMILSQSDFDTFVEMCRSKLQNQGTGFMPQALVCDTKDITNYKAGGGELESKCDQDLRKK